MCWAAYCELSEIGLRQGLTKNQKSTRLSGDNAEYCVRCSTLMKTGAVLNFLYRTSYKTFALPKGCSSMIIQA